MKRLAYKLMRMQKESREGSFGTQAGRISTLNLIVEQLDELGYKTNKLKPQDLKGRHINALIKKWQSENLAIGTIKNRLSAIRWWAKKIGKADMVKTNNEYGIPNRQYITNENKALLTDATHVDTTKLSSHVKASVMLQKYFGLRREEAMKFQIDYALQGYTAQSRQATFIRIKPSWAKGGGDIVRYRLRPMNSINY